MMNDYDSASSYHRSTALGASALGQVITLYDMILLDLRHAIDAISVGKIEERVNCTNHALVVIGELQGVLDFEKGGDAARHLNNFYNVTRAMVTDASVTSSVEKLQELISMFAHIRAAWSHVEGTITPSAPKDRLRGSSKPQAVFPPETSPPLESSEGSAQSRWSA